MGSPGEDDSDISSQIYVALGLRETKLVQSILIVYRDVVAFRASLLARGMNKLQSRLAVLQEEAGHLQMAYERPYDLLTDEQKGKLSVNPELHAAVLSGVRQANDGGNSLLFRVFSLLDHAEGILSQKISVVYFKRTVALSMIAVAIAAISLLVSA
ncbi:MAG: hypothetical protein NTU41_01280 [Chloroflexi bacterium]|nr:hypothetical protein [Chloroflexota bacterium]